MPNYLLFLEMKTKLRLGCIHVHTCNIFHHYDFYYLAWDFQNVAPPKTNKMRIYGIIESYRHIFILQC